MGKLGRITNGSACKQPALMSHFGAAWSPGQNLRESNAGCVTASASPAQEQLDLLWASDPKLGVAGQRQGIGGTLCASVAEARLRQDDVLGRLGGEARPKARPFIKRQIPEPSSSQLLRSGCLRHADIPTAGREEVPAHAITQPVRSAPKNHGASLRGSDPHSQDQESKELHLFIEANTSHALARGVRDGQDLLVASRQTETYPAAEWSCPLLCQQILPSSRLSTIGTLRGRKGELALQEE